MTLRSWVKEQEPDIVDAVMMVFEDTFLDAGTSVIHDKWLDKYDDPKPIRAKLWKLSDLRIVRTVTIEGRNERGKHWLFHHWVCNFPGQRVEEIKVD